MKKSEELRTKILNVRTEVETELLHITGMVKEAYLKANPDIEDIDDTMLIELPNSIVFDDNPDGNLIEAIERVSVGGDELETFLTGDGTMRNLNEFTEIQLISVIEQLETLLEKPETIELY